MVNLLVNCSIGTNVNMHAPVPTELLLSLSAGRQCRGHPVETRKVGIVWSVRLALDGRRQTKELPHSILQELSCTS